MSEPTVATATGPPRKPKKKILGLPVPVVIGGVAALAAFGYIWWRDRHKSAASASVTTSTSSANQAQLDQIQQELDQLLGQGSASTGTGTGSGGGGGGGTGTSTSTLTVPPPIPFPPVKTAVNPVKGLRITETGTTSVTGAWDKSAGATSYLITVRQGGNLVKTQHSAGTTARVGNLKRGTQYEYRVRAQPGGTGGSDASVSVTTKGVVVNPGGPNKKAK